MKVKYIGQSFYRGRGLTDGGIYECLGVEYGFLRIIDDEDEDYLYSAKTPQAPNGSTKPGRWEIIEDDENGTLREAIYGV